MAKPPGPISERLPPDDAVEAMESPEERLALDGRGLRAHTARGVIINSAFQVIYAALGLLRRVAAAAFLTTTQFGLWGILVTTLITLSWLKQIGVSDKYVQQDEADQEAAFQKAFTLELGYTLCFYVVIVAALPVYALIYGRADILLPGFILSLALLGSALHTPIWVFYRQMRFVRQRTLEGVEPVVSTAVTIALAVAGASYWSLVIGAVAGSFAGAIAALVTCPYRLAIRFDRDTLREYFGFSWPLVAMSASSLVVVQGSVFVGNETVGLAGIGAIGLATTFATFADRVQSIISRTMYPAVCAVKERADLLFEAFAKSNRLALMWALPFGFGLALFGPDFVTYVLGERWREAEGLIQAFGLILGFGQVAFNWTVFMRALDRTRPMALNGALQVVSFLAVTAPLMFWLGLSGYAIGMSVALLIQLAVRGYFMSRLFEGFNLLAHMARSVGPSVPAVAAVLGLRALAQADRTVEMVIAELVLYLTVTAVSTYLFERSLLSEIAGYVRRARMPRALPTG